jgi:hypothetical protein
MLMASNVRSFLEAAFPTTKFYAGTINKNDTQCIGIYPRERVPFEISVGGTNNTSSWTLPLSILVHWSEDTFQCEQKASELYEFFVKAKDTTISGISIISFKLKDSCPVDLKRDSNNICEMVIRLDVIYKNQITE